jgi:hypothetical protein
VASGASEATSILDTENLTGLQLTATVPALHLGESSYVYYYANNPNAGTTIHLNSVSAGTITVDSDHAACPAGSFTLTDFSSYGPQNIGPGVTNTVAYEVLHYNNLSVPQNACIGAKLTVSFSTT